MKRTIVIARYNEDVKWLEKIDPSIDMIIYNKGNPVDEALLQNKGRNLSILPLENVGNCVHTCAHHIVINYDRLEDFGLMIFIQGYLHDNNNIQVINDLKGDERFGQIGFPWIITPPTWDLKGEIHVCQKKMWEEIGLEESLPSRRCYPIGNQWYAGPKFIKKRPKSFFERIAQAAIKYDRPWKDYDSKGVARPVPTFGGLYEGCLPFFCGGYSYKEWLGFMELQRHNLSQVNFPVLFGGHTYSDWHKRNKKMRRDWYRKGRYWEHCML